MKFLSCILILGLSACATGASGTATPSDAAGNFWGAYRFTPSGGPVPAALSAGCKLQVFSTKPDGPFDEIGILDWTGAPSGKTGGPFGCPRTAGEVVAMVRKLVCGQGGEGLLLEANGFGDYMKATVIKFRQPASEPAPPTPAS